jgi:hypothetical protein
MVLRGRNTETRGDIKGAASGPHAMRLGSKEAYP